MADKTQHIAITGGAGFIGTALARIFVDQGHKVTLLDIKPSSAFPDLCKIADMEDPDALGSALQGVDVIYHLAAEHRDDVSPVSRYYDVNVQGAKNLVQAADQNNIKNIIFTSSVAVYGLDKDESSEDSPPDPFNDYGRSKWQAEQVLDEWVAHSPDRTLVHVRLVAVFGPGNRGNIYTLMEQIYKNRFVMIGNGKNRKSIACLGNITAFLNHCLRLPAGRHLYNYADKPDQDMNTMVSHIRRFLGRKGTGPRLPYLPGYAGGAFFDMLAAMTGRKFPISRIRVEKFCANTIVNADRAHRNFQAPLTLAEGLDIMLEHEFGTDKPENSICD